MDEDWKSWNPMIMELVNANRKKENEK